MIEIHVKFDEFFIPNINHISVAFNKVLYAAHILHEYKLYELYVHLTTILILIACKTNSTQNVNAAMVESVYMFGKVPL